MIDAFLNAKQKFRYPEEIHVSHRQTAGYFLASSGLKKNVHYSVGHRSREIVYHFKNERDRLVFQMWKPIEINKLEMNKIYGKFGRGSMFYQTAFYYAPYIPLTITSIRREIALEKIPQLNL